MQDIEPNKPTVLKLVAMNDAQQDGMSLTDRQNKEVLSLKYPSRETYASRSFKQL